MGSWATHFSYYNTTELAQSSDMVYSISEGNLFSVSKKHENINTYSKINYLSDGSIGHIAYSEENGTLVIGYSNSNIDILKNNRTINISDLKRKDIPDKEINNISFYKHYAYLACGFGIVVIDLKKNEIADTYIIGENGNYLKIINVQAVNNHIYAQTASGISYAELSNHNLSNFENWNSLILPEGVTSIRDMAAYQNDLVAISNDNRILRFNGNEWHDEIPYIYHTRIKVIGNDIIFFKEEEYFLHLENWVEKQLKWVPGIKDITYTSDENCYWAVIKSNNNQAVLTKIEYSPEEDNPVYSAFIPNGPYSSKVAFIKYRNGKILTGSGGPFDLSGRDHPGIVQLYENNKWTIVSQKDFPEGIVEPGYAFLDVLDAELDPKDTKRMYVATWKSVFEFYDNVLVKHYHNNNSTIETASVGSTDALTDGLCFDKNNNLWLLNMLTRNMLKIKKADGEWTSVYYPEIAGIQTVKEIFISKNGYKWIIVPKMGLFVINDKGTPFDTRDDNTRYFNSFQENTSSEIKTLIPTVIRCIAEDQNNTLWIGTDLGPLLITNQNNVFNSNFTIDRVKITREDNPSLADYLLENERINAIVVDGGNRKWIGTASSGAYLLSSNGQETIHHFTTENSPLTSNEVIDIALNDETGEVFIATASNIFSFKSDASKGAQSYSNVYAYPNPVYENYNGLITVKGLMDKSVVKIADVEGNLIYQGYSNGGTFTWDGKNMDGRRVATGIYLVFSALDDGSEKVVTKIAFIN
jgi:hypothetical protein